MTNPSTRCVSTWVVCMLSGLPGRLAGEKGGWLGPLTAAGKMGGGRGGEGGGRLLLLVSWDGSSTTGDLMTEQLDMMEDEPVVAEQSEAEKVELRGVS